MHATTLAAKVRYIASAAALKLSGRPAVCPSCGGRESRMTARKHLVTELRRCAGCELLFVVPTLSAIESGKFYATTAYSQGFTTELPSEDTLQEWLVNRFRGTEKDYSRYVSVLGALDVPKGARVFDFGCSWGYGSWQLMNGGFQVEAFEISPRRAAYARDRLGVVVHNQLPAAAGSYDVFFSAHVLEHVPSVAQAIAYGMAALKPGGFFVAFTPNGSDVFRHEKPWNWMRSWGLVHPNSLDDVYYRRAWAGGRYLLASNPYPPELLRRWVERREGSLSLDLSGSELLLVGVAP